MEVQVIEVELVDQPEALAVVPPDQAVHWLERVATDTQRLVTALPHYTDDELVECRRVADTLHHASWIVICATDHEIMKRAQPVKNRREGDLSKSGIYATAARQAHAVGLDPTTILRNATIYKNFGHILTSQDDPEALRLTEILTDKGYWDAAAHAPEGEMRSYLDYFAAQKEADPRFTVKAAWRYVNEQKAPPITMALPPLRENEAADAALAYIRQGFTMLNQATGNRLRGVLKGYEEELEYELKLPPCTVMERIATLIDEGWDEIDVIKERAGWPRDWVVAWFKQMEAADWARSFPKGQVEGARGAPRKGWTLTDQFYKELKAIKAQGVPEVVELSPQDWNRLSIK